MLLDRSTKSFLAVSAKFSVFFCVCDEDFACLNYLELSDKTFLSSEKQAYILGAENSSKHCHRTLTPCTSKLTFIQRL